MRGKTEPTFVIQLRPDEVRPGDRIMTAWAPVPGEWRQYPVRVVPTYTVGALALEPERPRRTSR